MQNTQAAGDRILARWTTWQGSVRYLAGGIILSTVVNVALVADRIYTAHHPPEPKYFVTDGNNNQCQVIPLNEPVMSDADLLEWVSKAALAPYNFNYVHYRATLSKDAQPYFTANGWNTYAANLIDAKTFREIEKQGYTVAAVPMKPPTLADHRIVDGVMTWVFEMPILVSYRNLNGSAEQRLLARLTVVRMPPRFHPKGIAVEIMTTQNIS